MLWHSSITQSIAVEYWWKFVSLKINNIQFAYIFIYICMYFYTSWWSVRKTETCSIIDTNSKELYWSRAIHLVISKFHITDILDIFTKQQNVISQVFTLLIINYTVFWDVTPCCLRDGHQHSGGINCLLIQGTRVLVLHILLPCRWM